MAVGGASGPGGGGNSGRGGPGGPGGPGGAPGGRGGANGAANSGNNSGGNAKGDATSKGPDDGSRGVGSSTSTAETGKADATATEAPATEAAAQEDKSTVSDDAATTNDKTEQAAQDFAEGLLGAMVDDSTPESAVDEAREVANEIAQETVEEAKGLTAGDLAEGATAFDRAAGMLSAALEDSSRFGLGTKAVEMGVDTTGALTGGVQTGQDIANEESLTDVALGVYGTTTDMVDVSATLNDLAGNKGRIAGALSKGARVMGPMGGLVEGGLQAAYAETPSDVLSGGLKAAAGGLLLGGTATGPGALGTTVAAGGLYGTSLALDYTPLGGMFNSAYSDFMTPSQPAYRDESGGGGGGGGGGGW